MKDSIHLIRADNFTQEVINERQPILLLCMARDDNFRLQINLIEKIYQNYKGFLKLGLLEEAFIATFKKNYKVVGTPTFLILNEGKERNRFLGLADEQSLMDFLADTIALNGGSSSER